MIRTHADMGIKDKRGRRHHRTLCGSFTRINTKRMRSPRLTYVLKEITCGNCLKSKRLQWWEDNAFAHQLNEIDL